MSTITKSAVALAASVALGAGMTMGAAPSAEAACSTMRVCSMQAAQKVVAGKAVYGARNASVRQLQLSLRNVGFKIAVDGYFGNQTRTTLKKYQYMHRLSQTGRVDAATLRALRTGHRALRGLPTATKTVTKVTSSVTSSSTNAQQAVNYAYSKLGKPYRYGATGPNSFDCSGLTQAAYRAAGVSIPRTSYAQLGGLKRVSLSSLKPGDIVGFYGGGHVGIYIGNGYVIHAPRTGDVVRKAKMSTMRPMGAVRPS